MSGEIPYGSLGGQPLAPAATIIQEFIKNGLDYSGFYRRANSYTCKLGAEPGMGYVLMQQEFLKNLDSRQPQDLMLGIGPKSITIKNLAVIQAQRILSGATNDPDGLYLVTLADVRWFLKRTIINKRYNIRKYCTENGWIVGTLQDSASTPWTFAQICEDIWGHFSGFGNFFSGFETWSAGNISGTPPTDAPENLRFENVSALDALNQVCQQNGFYLRYDPTIGDLSIIKIGFIPDPNPGLDGWMADGFGISPSVAKRPFTAFFSKLLGFTPRTATDNLTEDTELFTGIPVIPEMVHVVFPTNGAGCNDIDNTNSNAGRGWYYSVSKTADAIHLSDLTGSEYDYLDSTTSDTSVILYSSTFAQFADATETIPANLTDLGNIATRIAKDYYRTAGKNANGRVVFREIKDIVPGPIVTEVTWREWGDGLKTELAKSPLPVGLLKPPKMFAEGSAGSSGPDIIGFEITDIVRGLGYLCNAVEGVVISIACNSSAADIGDVVTIWDGLLCTFQFPMGMLIGIQGYAMRMQTPYLEPQGEGDLAYPGETSERPCRWEVMRLCCVEEQVI